MRIRRLLAIAAGTLVLAPAVAQAEPIPTKVAPLPVSNIGTSGGPEARVTTLDGSTVLVGKRVDFFDRARKFVCTATTGFSGKARCPNLAPEILVALTLGYSAAFPGDDQYAGSSAFAPFFRVGDFEIGAG
jgi:hypothetical protein